jgi:hypothetical protein
MFCSCSVHVQVVEFKVLKWQVNRLYMIKSIVFLFCIMVVPEGRRGEKDIVFPVRGQVLSIPPEKMREVDLQPALPV